MEDTEKLKLEEIAYEYNQLFYSSCGKVCYRIIASNLNKLADDIICSTEKEVSKTNTKTNKVPDGLVARLAENNQNNLFL